MKILILVGFFESPPSNKVHVYRFNLREIRNKIWLDYKGDFELNGLMIIGLVEQKTNFEFRNMDDFESFINATDIDYDSEDVTFTGYVYNFNTPQFNVVNRSAYAEGTNYGQAFDEYFGQNCYIPTSVQCFIKSSNYFTQKDYAEELLTFI